MIALPAAAQTPAPADAAAYVDREIEGLALEQEPESAALKYDSTGWPRYLRLESRLATEPFRRQGSASLVLGGYGLLETPNHGNISFDGQYSPRRDDGTFTLRQRGLPLGGGWFANHEAGLIVSAAPAVSRESSRVFVPTSYLEGIGGEWQNPTDGWQVQLSSGEPGQPSLSTNAGFDRLPGRRDTFGLQWRGSESSAAEGWTLATQWERGRGIQPFSSQTGAPFDAQGTRWVARRETDTLNWQVQLLRSNQRGLEPTRQGVWVDADWGRGAWAHSAGSYHLDDGLTWAGLPMTNDLKGVYLRTGYTQRRWSADGSIDFLRSLGAGSPDGYFATTNVRWRPFAESSVAAGLALRDLGETDWNIYLEWRSFNGWGPYGVRLELEDGESRADAQRLTYDQDWSTRGGWAVSTSLSVARFGQGTANADSAGTQAGAAINFDVPLGSRAGVRGSLQTEQGPGSRQRDSVNLGANWRLTPRWSFDAGLVWSNGRSRQTFILDPLAPPVVFEDSLSTRSYFLALRYELEAGSRNVPLGGNPTEGGGRVEGVVFFDENRNGRQEANENGVPNATVFLDNRYAVRTDSQGRFVFAFVATGERTVTLRSETLPLPWTAAGEGSARTEVRLRSTNRLILPVQRSE